MAETRASSAANSTINNTDIFEQQVRTAGSNICRKN